jgi:hypothetical protein
MLGGFYFGIDIQSKKSEKVQELKVFKGKLRTLKESLTERRIRILW